MNWKTYDGMTEKQKEEYDFRFGQKPEIQFSKNFWFIFALLMWFIVMLAVSYLVMQGDENFVQLEDQMPQIITSMSQIIQVILFITVLNVVINVISILWYYSKRYWWMKRNRIVKQKDYFWRNQDGSL